MNYRFYLRLKIDDHDWKEIGIDHTIKWDTRDLIYASSGWTIMNQESFGHASDIVSMLRKGIVELSETPQSYTSFEVLHGFGTANKILTFYKDLLEDCNKYPYSELCGEIAD